MKPLDVPPAPATSLVVRTAKLEDRDRLMNLIAYESHVHKHLDWRPPLDWLGQEPFIVLEEGRHMCGALACIIDPEAVAWLRLFAFASYLRGPMAWRQLWEAAEGQLQLRGGATAAAIAMHRWLDPILMENGFQLVNSIVLLEMDITVPHQTPRSADGLIRAMKPEDLPAVVDVDAAAFDPLWRNSLGALTNAYNQAAHASVVEDETGLLGYQLSTGGAFGTHLARLAVVPAAQGRGLGAALIQDLVAHIPRGREPRLTVNTQADNAASHALYARMGFRQTGERFPVFALDVPRTA